MTTKWALSLLVTQPLSSEPGTGVSPLPGAAHLIGPKRASPRRRKITSCSSGFSWGGGHAILIDLFLDGLRPIPLRIST